MCIDHFALGLLVFEVVHDEIAAIVAGLLRLHAVLAFEECRQAIVTLQQIVDGGDAILALRVDLLTMKTS